MNEPEYILMTNKTNVDVALRAMRDTLPDFDDVIKSKERSKIIEQLTKWQQDFYKKIKVKE